MEGSSLEHEPPFKWRWPDLLAFGTFFLGTVVFLPVIAFLFFRVFEPTLQLQDLSGAQQIVTQALMDFLLVAFIVFYVKNLHQRPVRTTLRWIPRPDFPIHRMIPAGAVLAVFVTILSQFLPASPNAELEKLLSTTTSYVLFVILGIAFAPVCEEIIFRGFLFTALADLCGTKIAVLLTATVFAALHIPLRADNLPAVPVIFGAGLIFTMVRHRSGSVIPSVVMHTVYNATIFAIPALGTLIGFIN